MGAGLDPELNGYENIIRMSMLLGVTHADAEAKIPDIEAFSELGDFLSVPVRTYSAGMVTRLQFGVATSVEPEILLIDEGLATGDAAFQTKAQTRMERFIEKASVLVIASHSRELLSKYSNEIVQLTHGRMS